MISIIIPVLNEERALPATLQHVFSQAGEFEVIVVDGGSTDNTLAIVSQDNRIQLVSAATGRASQMNAGAQQASGDWLLNRNPIAHRPPGYPLFLAVWQTALGK